MVGDNRNKYCVIETAFDNKKELDEVVELLLENELVCSCQVVMKNI